MNESQIDSIKTEIMHLEKRIDYLRNNYNKWKSCWVKEFNAGNKQKALLALNHLIQIREQLKNIAESKESQEELLISYQKKHR